MNHFYDLDSDFVRKLSVRVILPHYAQKLSEGSKQLCASDNYERIQGILAYYKNCEENRIFISHFGVSKTQQGQGIGRRLLESLIEDNQGLTLELEVERTNQKAISLYLAEGFEILSETNTYLYLRRPARE